MRTHETDAAPNEKGLDVAEPELAHRVRCKNPTCGERKEGIEGIQHGCLSRSIVLARAPINTPGYLWDSDMLSVWNYRASHRIEAHDIVKIGASLEFTRARNSWQRRWWITASIILALGTLLRVYELSLKPLHHDDAVNGFFLLGLFREGIYRYNPANYHGPTLYYFALISCSINNLLFGDEGPSTVAVRMVPVLFGIGIIGIVLTFRDRLGTIGTLAASTLAAVSPGMVYLSRDFIYEMPLGFFTLWLSLCSMRFAGTGKTGQTLLGAIAAALMFCTKETAPLCFFSLLLGVIAAVVWAGPYRPRIVPNFGTWRRQILLQAVAAVALFLVSSFLFF